MNGIIGPEKALGDFINIKSNLVSHFKDDEPKTEGGTSFSDMMLKGINDVNSKQLDFEELSVKAITDPESVNADDVTNSLAQANMSLNIAKNVIDRVLRAYQTLTTLR